MMQTTQTTPNKTPFILMVNGRWSSITFAVFAAASAMKRLLSGQVERIRTPGARLMAKLNNSTDSDTTPVVAAMFHEGVQSILVYLRRQLGITNHGRGQHGMMLSQFWNSVSVLAPAAR